MTLLKNEILEMLRFPEMYTYLVNKQGSSRKYYIVGGLRSAYGSLVRGAGTIIDTKKNIVSVVSEKQKKGYRTVDRRELVIEMYEGGVISEKDAGSLGAFSSKVTFQSKPKPASIKRCNIAPSQDSCDINFLEGLV